jgi:hypothetical protein
MIDPENNSRWPDRDRFARFFRPIFSLADSFESNKLREIRPMKAPYYLSIILAGVVFVAGDVSGASYSTDFSGYALDAELAGQDGWTINDSTPDASMVLGLGTVWGSRTASLGFVAPLEASSVYVSHPVSAPLTGNASATFSVMFQVVDSDSSYNENPGDGAEARDTFGFRLEDGSKNNLFSLFLTPFDQDAKPEDDTAFHTYSWSTGNGPKTDVLIPPDFSPRRTAQENFAYTFSISFATSGADLAFTGNINGDKFSGTLTGLGGTSIERLGAFWNPLNGPDAPGTNQLLFDNVSLVSVPATTPVAGKLSNPAFSPTTGFSCTFTDATVGQSYRIQSSLSLESNSWSDVTTITYSGPTAVTDPSAVGQPQKFYRVIIN